MEADLSTIGKLAEWELSHILEHTRLARRASAMGTPLPSYPLDFSFTPAWLHLHNEQHRALRHKYGISETRDFNALNPDDQQARSDWLNDHYVEHQLIANKV